MEAEVLWGGEWYEEEGQGGGGWKGYDWEWEKGEGQGVGVIEKKSFGVLSTEWD